MGDIKQTQFHGEQLLEFREMLHEAGERVRETLCGRGGTICRQAGLCEPEWVCGCVTAILAAESINSALVHGKSPCRGMDKGDITWELQSAISHAVKGVIDRRMTSP